MPQPLRSDFPPPEPTTLTDPSPGPKLRRIVKEKRYGPVERMRRAMAWHRDHATEIVGAAGDDWFPMLGRTYCLI